MLYQSREINGKSKKLPIRKFIRLTDFDYSRPGAYFVTIRTLNKKYCFGKISNDKMILIPFGEIVENNWCELTTHFSFIDLDFHIVMSNHLHGIIFINLQNMGLLN